MNCIKEHTETEIIIKKSRFICNIKTVAGVEDAKRFINSIKHKYSDATHNCSAYIVGSYEKADDDGEPNQTAGLPILNIMKQHDIQNTACVVTRYFGGIKLGAGGLIRAYAKSANAAISEAEIVHLIDGIKFTIAATYADSKWIEYQLDKVLKLRYGVSYNLNVDYQTIAPVEVFEQFKQEIESYNHLIKVEVVGKLKIPQQ